MTAIDDQLAKKARIKAEVQAEIAEEKNKAEHKASAEKTGPAPTDKQRKFIEKLCGELAEYERDIAIATWKTAKNEDEQGRLTRIGASQLIDALKGMVQQRREKDHRAPQSGEPEAGIYRSGKGKLYRVYFGQQSGRMLVKEIVSASEEDGLEYRYVGSARRIFTADDSLTRLPVEEVGKLGLTVSHCLMCGKKLDDPESVDRGIGPVCASNY